MRTFDEAMAVAADKMPFSNGTEGTCWTDNWCDRCTHDRPARTGDPANGCPLLMVALLGRTPAEWTEKDPASLGDRYHCTQFSPDNGPGDDPEPEPRWDPEMPGQTDIFAEFTDQAVERFEAEQRTAVAA